MKKYIAILGFFVAFALNAQAQLRTTYRAQVNQGQYLDFPGSWAPASSASTPAITISDTLQVSDTVAYVIPINHQNDVTVFQSWYWNKIGSGTATITLTFFSGNDPYNLTPVLKGSAQSAYSKSYTLSASGWNYVDFANDTARLSGRYLKVQYMTSSTASVGGKVFTRLKTTIK